MNDNPKGQESTEKNMDDTTKSQLFKEVESLAGVTADYVASELEVCLQNLKRDPGVAVYLNKVACTRDTLQKCFEHLEVLIQLENDAVRLRELVEKQPVQKS